MLNGKNIAVVMPAYNAAKTLSLTYDHLPHEIVDTVILVDDNSRDETVRIARELGIHTFAHKANFGYGRNQKTCYAEALRLGADIVIMVHPDYQYSPELVTSMAGMLAYGVYDVALASRILGVGARKGGMPLYKYVANRFLTLTQNILLNYKLSEYHTGYRAFTRDVLEKLPLHQNTDDFSFDNEMLAQAIFFGYRLGEISCPTKYFEEASSINFSRSVKYGLEVLSVSLKFRLERLGLGRFPIFCRETKTEQATARMDYYECMK
ncbi:Glycosyltransferase involved in cell wall bisynthesis [Granulicella rosea]|uniref:Glycosyltransferase involved in cell wall bisynthesis n=1 Tax=Granulicella rosea TaxID=474952 RepID=A0A239IT55_9BACT|nr:glycosyltransferase family 2 protein [Granulicella rosea]SNS96771.1 Glycosyltransferase involved in cell wall bisynthesis [Granulicella rosea]